MKLTRNADKSKFIYKCREIAFDSEGMRSFGNDFRICKITCPTCSRVLRAFALRALVPYVSRASRALVPPRALRSLVPFVPRAVHALVHHVVPALRALVFCMASCLALYEPVFLTYPIASITLK